MARFPARLLAAAIAAAATAAAAPAQTAYGVNATNQLIRVDLANPAAGATVVGNLNLPAGFDAVALDFRPGTAAGAGVLYGLARNNTSARLFTVDLGTGAAAAVGAGFSLFGSGPGGSSTTTGQTVNYDVANATQFGFDFNPNTLQPDNVNVRIRLTANAPVGNFRLDSATGGIANVDGPLSYGGGAAPLVAASAYTNSDVAEPAGSATTPTALYNIDLSRGGVLALQTDPNDGELSQVGSGLGIAPGNVVGGVGFDILTQPGTTANTAYLAVNQGAGYELRTVDLTAGTSALAGLFGPGADFARGFAVAPVPEPASGTLVGAAGLAGVAAVRRRLRRPATA